MDNERNNENVDYTSAEFAYKGVVSEVRDGVVYADGLHKAKMAEVVLFEEIGLKGIVNYLDKKNVVGILVLGNSDEIYVGDKVICLNVLPTIKVGYGILGKVVNPLGEVIDGSGDFIEEDEVIIDSVAPGIIYRQPVDESMETGIKFIDSMVPIGCGQRELIIGDPKTGKTSVAIDVILNQENKDIVCVYVAIGQKQSSVLRIKNLLVRRGCMDKTVIVSATAGDSAVMQYLAPFAGCSIGEFFMNKLRKVVVIYDDLSKHAVAYRQMSLLLRRPPGREGYPGDVFFLHSRLLERAARLKNYVDTGLEVGVGSLTALPVIETVDGDVSAYIPTNVISITDGQIFLEKELFNKGTRPAVSPGISVSRVGSAAQNNVIKKLAGPLKLDLAQYRELYEFVQLGMPLDSSSRRILEKGERLQKLMVQPVNLPVHMSLQIIMLVGGLKGFFNSVSAEWLNLLEKKISKVVRHESFERLLGLFLKIEVPKVLISFVLNGVLSYLKNKESVYN